LPMLAQATTGFATGHALIPARGSRSGPVT
jgi:hypothetical protein